MKTRFERYLEDSIIQYKSLMGKVVTGEVVMEAFFPKKTAKKVKTFVPKEKGMNAIIVVGPPCSGKTTFARKYAEEHPEFKLISLDTCALEEMKKEDDFSLFLAGMGIIEKDADDYGNRRFGQMLEEKHSNIIIDGNWMHLNARGALLKTLESLGYNTCIFLIMPRPQVQLRMIRNKTVNTVAAARLLKDPIQMLEGGDFLKEYAEYEGCSIEEITEDILESPEYEMMHSAECDLHNKGIRESLYHEQLSSAYVQVGADEFKIVIL